MGVDEFGFLCVESRQRVVLAHVEPGEDLEEDETDVPEEAEHSAHEGISVVGDEGHDGDAEEQLDAGEDEAEEANDFEGPHPEGELAEVVGRPGARKSLELIRRKTLEPPR